MSVLELHGIQRVFDDGTVGLAGVDLSVAAGELVGVVGPSGAGKTTLLRVIAGLDEPDGGTVTMDGVDVTNRPARERNIAMVFQEQVIYPRRNVRETIAFPLELRRTPLAERDARVDAEASALGLWALLEWDPALLSSGHQQAVQTAKALVGRPDLYLFDEPLSRLDTAHRGIMRREFRTLQRGYGIAAVWVTNDRDEALAISDRLVVLAGGAVIEAGPTRTMYDEPGSMFTADFISGMNLIEGSVSGDRIAIAGGTLRCWWPGLTEYSRVVVGIRPEQISVVEPGAGIDGLVDHVEFLGDRYLVHLVVGASPLTAVTTRPVSGAVGVEIDPTRVHLFDPGTGSAVFHPLTTGGNGF